MKRSYLQSEKDKKEILSEYGDISELIEQEFDLRFSHLRDTKINLKQKLRLLINIDGD